MGEPENAEQVTRSSIANYPWQFACQWYTVEGIYNAIKRGNIDGKPLVPSDVTSREFAEWLTDQYRLAMRKGAELATREMQSRIDETAGEVRVESSPRHMLHRLWTSCVGKPGYNKETWREIERQLKVTGIIR